ncbi:hypothetical protein C7H19_23915 [Aphanothece hegewaldii CCALA 016]|uniref:Uncharacterized protein n=1 Tax=Aphanothece hegewaldii CCALA 016 TaxID=2107694 RepID=A0A2T1LQY4_9CHRO|nr:hypothetical protein C7H19_23915 [Aphanothece hegewaldii CCALA 016]
MEDATYECYFVVKEALEQYLVKKIKPNFSRLTQNVHRSHVTQERLHPVAIKLSITVGVRFGQSYNNVNPDSRISAVGHCRYFLNPHE